MNLTLIYLERSNKKSIQLKRVDNLKLVYESGLSDYLEEEFLGGTIVLFGSFSTFTIPSFIRVKVLYL